MSFLFAVPVVAVAAYDVIKMKKKGQPRQIAVYIALVIIALCVGALCYGEGFRDALAGLVGLAQRMEG